MTPVKRGDLLCKKLFQIFRRYTIITKEFFQKKEINYRYYGHGDAKGCKLEKANRSQSCFYYKTVASKIGRCTNKGNHSTCTAENRHGIEEYLFFSILRNRR